MRRIAELLAMQAFSGGLFHRLKHTEAAPGETVSITGGSCSPRQPLCGTLGQGLAPETPDAVRALYSPYLANPCLLLAAAGKLLINTRMRTQQGDKCTLALHAC